MILGLEWFSQSKRRTTSFRGEDYKGGAAAHLQGCFIRDQKQVLTVNETRSALLFQPAWKTDKTIRIKGAGAARNCGEKGETSYLYLPHRRGPQLSTHQEATRMLLWHGPYTAVPGETGLSTLDGKAAITVPPEAENGRKYAWKGKGYQCIKREKPLWRPLHHFAGATPKKLSEKNGTIPATSSCQAQIDG